MILLCLLVARANAPDFGTWVSRGDSANDNLKKAAEALATTAEGIAAAGRVEQLAALQSDAAEVVRRADLLVAIVNAEP